MAPEPTNSQKNLDQEVRELIFALTNRLSGIQRSQKSNVLVNQDEDDHGVGIITLAGTNIGATMRGDMEEKTSQAWPQESDDFATFVNSNFQGINNSIMMDGSYNTNDPGVHLDISEDYLERDNKHPTRRGRNGKMKEAESSKTDLKLDQSG